jgi:hypothetical protein
MMKKLLLGVISTLAVMAIPLGSASALTNVSDVTGHVSINGQDVSGASVDATCKTASATGTTGSNGDYNVVLSPSDVCGPNDVVTVVATKGSASGQSSAKLSNYYADDNVSLNVALVNVSLPEMGILTAAGAGIIGAGAFMVIRRRNLSGHQL